ncbi:hypothetical protein CAPTEDRAFT_191315 [Capitella teleta]|uniref:Uncharacterized protein n=1 Tax=Capitella teleta TaxID=283909 RepID=R7UDM3_CAPTE|nr:hypothetical protein CAPTEDRAFT_191315 [Capitella teleta]|eukprot:ELU01888.1 hypothetical protein CAPTEDRAFT_191315 [Capitella teleta]
MKLGLLLLLSALLFNACHGLAPKLVPLKNHPPPLGRRAIPFSFDPRALSDILSDIIPDDDVTRDPCWSEDAEDWLLRWALSIISMHSGRVLHVSSLSCSVEEYFEIHVEDLELNNKIIKLYANYINGGL